MLKIKKGDMVMVISGDDRGKVGKVLKVFPKKNRVIVEGVNFIKRHTRPSQKNPQGGIIEKEAPIHISNVMLYHDGNPTKVGFKILKDGRKVRYSKKTGEVIDT
ncbi:MAG: 50S ribosomal protein L24 [Candidatus Marinimicrobia bacterium]|nr:50S ribosomal protein L24 [Candidatus Neomarinimicrobiota bacterium]